MADQGVVSREEFEALRKSVLDLAQAMSKLNNVMKQLSRENRVLVQRLLADTDQG